MNFFNNRQVKTKGKLRVLYFTPYFTSSNIEIENYMTNEVNAVVRNYKNIEFLIYGTTNPKFNEVIRYSERILLVNRISYKSLIFIKDMIKIFTKFKPQVIHSHYVVPSIFVNSFAKIFRVPTILHGRGQDVNYWPYFKIKSKILLLIAGTLSSLILTVCKSMKNDCIRFKIPKNKVRVIYNGIDFRKFSPKDKNFYSNHRRLELIHVGSFEPRKGQLLIIEVCKKLKDYNIKFHLTLIGKNTQNQTLINLINNYNLQGYVDLLGSVDHRELPNYLEKADLLIFPSITEGLPNAVLEAMSMKLSVILTKVDGHLEVAQNIGSVLIDINNPQQLFEAILHYYNNPKEIEIGGEINRNFIVKTFSWDKHAKELYQFYNSLANKKGSRDENQ
ncbi:MAG: glycosyltransferase family 4 protein [Promethearchaeota archaeon]